jgi:hypothetical protein
MTLHYWTDIVKTRGVRCVASEKINTGFGVSQTKNPALSSGVFVRRLVLVFRAALEFVFVEFFLDLFDLDTLDLT